MFKNLAFEEQLIKKGIHLIAGVDEVGRGPLAGPLVVSAVLLRTEKIGELLTINDVAEEKYRLYTYINDSKLVTEKRRKELSVWLKKEVLEFSIVEISNDEIDRLGVAQATQKAFYNSVINLSHKPEHILTDMFKIKKFNSVIQSNIVAGDKLSMTIGAASILGKVYRDDLMVKYHEKYPLYGFDKHKGYGTKFHIEALKKHGPSPIHRKSFEPVKSLFNNNLK